MKERIAEILREIANEVEHHPQGNEPRVFHSIPFIVKERIYEIVNRRVK